MQKSKQSFGMSKHRISGYSCKQFTGKKGGKKIKRKGKIKSKHIHINKYERVWHMKKYRLFWLDGKTEEISGDNIADAFTKAGYDSGDLSALDYYEEIK